MPAYLDKFQSPGTDCSFPFEDGLEKCFPRGPPEWRTRRKKEAPSQTTDTTRARAGGVYFRLTQELEFCERSGDGGDGGDGKTERAPVAQLASARAPTRRQTGVGSDDAKERRELYPTSLVLFKPNMLLL